MNEGGIDVDAAFDFVALGGKLTEFKGVTPITEGEFWALKSDIFVPAALENQLTEARAKTISTRLRSKAPTVPQLPPPTTSCTIETSSWCPTSSPTRAA